MARSRKTKVEDGSEPPVFDPADLPEASEDGSGGDVASETGGSAEPKQRRRRGPKAKLDPDGISSLLLSIHLGLASITATPEIALDKTEAKRLAEAAVEVASHYDIAVLSPKAMAWMHLGLIAAGIYGPRIMAYRMRAKFRPMEEPLA